MMEPPSSSLKLCTTASYITPSNSNGVPSEALPTLRLKTFHLFPKLPLEIRHLIYHFATPPQLIYSSLALDWIDASLVTVDGYPLRSPETAIDLDSWAENEKEATAYSTDYTSFYCKLNPLLHVSKEARQHVTEREGVYGFNKTLSTREEWHGTDPHLEDVRHKYIVRVWKSEEQEWKFLQKIPPVTIDANLTLSAFWRDAYWSPHIVPTICLNKAIFVVTMRRMAYIYCAAPSMAESIRSITISYWEWKLMIDDWYGDQAIFEMVLMRYMSLKEIIFVYDLQQNVHEMPLPPPWKSVENVIGEGMKELKKKYKQWTIPSFWVVRRNMSGFNERFAMGGDEVSRLLNGAYLLRG